MFGSHRLRSRLLLAAAPLYVALSLLQTSRVSGQAPCENESGYRPHSRWRGTGAYASPVNLLYEGTSFETGEPGISALDGVVYNQRQFTENLITEETVADAYLDPAFDATDAVHGDRSLRLDFDGPYPSGGPSAWCELSWEWFAIPEEDRYDISFYAKATRELSVFVGLVALDTLSAEIVWVDLDTTDDVAHEALTVLPGEWQRLTLRTPQALPTHRYYALCLSTGGAAEPSWCVPEGTTLWLDAVQVARAPEDGGAPAPFEYHTAAEELFLLVRSGDLPKWTNVFYAPDESNTIRGQVAIYQHPDYADREGGTLHWRLYALYPEFGDATDPIGGGSLAVGAFGEPLQTFEVDLSPHVSGRLGLYKWIVEFEDRFGLRADRQELTFALVRSAEVPAPKPGNFGVNMNVLRSYGRNASGLFSPAVSGRQSLRRNLDTVSRLGFTRDRVSSAFDWGTVWEDPDNPMHYDFYPDLAAEYGIDVFPVIASIPGWWTNFDWPTWTDFMEAQVARYGPGGSVGPGMMAWNIFNEGNIPGHFTPSYYARFLFGAADPIHTTTPPGEMLISINGWDMPDYLIELLERRVGEAWVIEQLDGVGVNRYASFDVAAEETREPEAPSSWHAEIPTATWVQRASRLAAQLVDTDGTGTVHEYPITETGVHPGYLQADRRSLIWHWDDGEHTLSVNAMSGSLVKAQRAAERFIRHQLLCLAEGGGPIYGFESIPRAATYATPFNGMFHTDLSPAAPLAAQAALVAELGNATFVRPVPASDLRGPGGAPNTDASARVLVFEDDVTGEFVVAAWTQAPETRLEFEIDPAAYAVTARDFQGNDMQVTGSGSFTWALTPAPSYIRVDASITPSGLAEAIDHQEPSPPTWISCWDDNGQYFVRFACANPGDLDSLRLYSRPEWDTTWTLEKTFAPWAHPDSAYVGSVTTFVVGRPYARASAIEMTTGDEVFSEEFHLVGVVGVDESVDPPISTVPGLTLRGPNPSSRTVAVQGQADGGGPLRLQVFDVSGRRVRVVHRPLRSSGAFEMTWDGRDDLGHAVPAGVYFLKVDQAGREIGRNRIVLLR